MDHGAEEPADGRAAAPRGDYFVQSLERGIAVIKAFSAAEPELTLSEIARRTGMTRAAARRFLLTFVDLGYVAVSDRRFRLRPTVLELGFTYLTTLTLPQLATPYLVGLSEELHETASVAVLDGPDVVYVARSGGRRVMATGITVGTRLPAYASSHGRVLLAGLTDDELDAYLEQAALVPRTARTITDPTVLRERVAQARERGWSLVDQELEEGVTSIAVPVHGPSGEVFGSMNVGTHSNRHTPEQLQALALDPLTRAVQQLERDLALTGIRSDHPLR
ncbi:IclR family transcriptional regulator domain-containing protein [Modestobacter versicolor]|uniref:IclR family pca regulon transcriptional regulator n=1 Tax=Modestobacter versicolor TaxID=429133 RepID=A0A323VE59_9ACTN|nr:IclR family transcriptional regulator C-terminal domain-containing protein [Modestobacter versicolor]MBB3677660.1 IclR family pca regulon transcriptional regulator [Modestobacter versicolor]PZA22490.1 IclR family transcriptional regulator [Modestobacter versicolor]